MDTKQKIPIRFYDTCYNSYYQVDRHISNLHEILLWALKN
jgi:hypothetical protein